MRLVPPAVVCPVSELSPGDLAKVPVFDDRPTLIIAAKLENGLRGLVCLEPGQRGQGVPKGLDFPFDRSQEHKAAICLGPDYTFAIGDLSQAQTYRPSDSRSIGALIVGPKGTFLRVQCGPDGSGVKRYLDTATGLILALGSEGDLPFAFLSWRICWANHGTPWDTRPPILSFPSVI